MDVSPAQIVSVATALIPFLEHDDANRALMGSNMMRQAVPLLITEAPTVGTGLEYRAAVDTGDVKLAHPRRHRQYVDANAVVVAHATTAAEDRYELVKFMRSNQGTLIHQKPIVQVGDRVEEMLRPGRRLLDRRAASSRSARTCSAPSCRGAATTSRTRSSSRSGSSRTTCCRPCTSTSTRSTRAPRSSATRRSRATSRTAPRSRCATSTIAASSASAPRSAPATCSSAR